MYIYKKLAEQKTDRWRFLEQQRDKETQRARESERLREGERGSERERERLTKQQYRWKTVVS